MIEVASERRMTVRAVLAGIAVWKSIMSESQVKIVTGDGKRTQMIYRPIRIVVGDMILLTAKKKSASNPEFPPEIVRFRVSS